MEIVEPEFLTSREIELTAREMNQPARNINRPREKWRYPAHNKIILFLKQTAHHKVHVIVESE